jgi:ABC-type cobalamin/Fe3+-siderophores transport system ATPase subunit
MLFLSLFTFFNGDNNSTPLRTTFTLFMGQIMQIERVEIENFRALKSVSVTLSNLSILLGENDAGKTSVLQALDKFFLGKKLNDAQDWFKQDITQPVSITLTIKGIPAEQAGTLHRADNSIVIRKTFLFEKLPQTKALLQNNTWAEVPKAFQEEWLSSDRFHFIPVRRDLAVQFSMNKTALLGKTLRARMLEKLASDGAKESLSNLKALISESLDEPRGKLEVLLRQQMHNDEVKLFFNDLNVDPVEGVDFSIQLTDDKAENVPIENRGAGTQNNLIIALFRLIADLNANTRLILAMEEPENSLHPKAQRQLLSVIQQLSAKSQVIVTTHSPVFIDRARFENNILMTRTAAGNSVAKAFNLELLSEVRSDLGIRASDALLKGGGNCALLVEGRTEEDGFPTFMEMCGMSEFQLGIAIINMDGSDESKVRNIAQLLHAYDVPCIIVLDKNAAKTAEEADRLSKSSLPNIKKVFCLKKGNIEDYYPLSIVAEVINRELSPQNQVTEEHFDSSKSGEDRLNDFKKVLRECGCGVSVRYLKTHLGGVGTRLLRERGIAVDPELSEIFAELRKIASAI